MVRRSGKLEKQSSGWILPAGAVATVSELDGDGDVKLKNPEGKLSVWIYKRFYKLEDRSKKKLTGK